MQLGHEAAAYKHASMNGCQLMPRAARALKRDCGGAQMLPFRMILI